MITVLVIKILTSIPAAFENYSSHAVFLTISTILSFVRSIGISFSFSTSDLSKSDFKFLKSLGTVCSLDISNLSASDFKLIQSFRQMLAYLLLFFFLKKLDFVT